VSARVHRTALSRIGRAASRPVTHNLARPIRKYERAASIASSPLRPRASATACENRVSARSYSPRATRMSPTARRRRSRRVVSASSERTRASASSSTVVRRKVSPPRTFSGLPRSKRLVSTRTTSSAEARSRSARSRSPAIRRPCTSVTDVAATISSTSSAPPPTSSGFRDTNFRAR
jgi:hypothetical protein